MGKFRMADEGKKLPNMPLRDLFVLSQALDIPCYISGEVERGPITGIDDNGEPMFAERTDAHEHRP